MSFHLLPPDSLELLVVSGADAARFLQGQVTCDIEALEAGQLQWGAVCTNKGRVITPFAVLRIQDSFNLVFHCGLAQLFKAALARYLPFYKCHISAVQPCSGLVADTAAIMAVATGQAPPAVGGVAPHDGGWMARLTDTPTLLASNQDRAQWLSAGAAAQDEADALRIWTLALLEAGHFPFRPDDTERYTPQELHYDRQHYVSFSKGCYTGQEIVARMHYRGKAKKQLYLATLWARDLPMDQNCVLLDATGKEVGPLLHPIRASDDRFLALVSLPVELDSTMQSLGCQGCERVELRPF